MNNKTEIVVSNDYAVASSRFRTAWDEYLDKEDHVKYEVVEMVTILEKDGFSRTKAIQKIMEDHKDLKGFSRATIYRELPKEVKQNYTSSPKKLRNTENVSNETFQESQGLKELREAKGVLEQSAKKVDIRKTEDIIGLGGTEDQDVIYDPKFVDSLIKENDELKAELFRLKKDYQELETKYKRLKKG